MDPLHHRPAGRYDTRVYASKDAEWRIIRTHPGDLRQNGAPAEWRVQHRGEWTGPYQPTMRACITWITAQKEENAG